jgi:hypothetical protein
MTGRLQQLIEVLRRRGPVWWALALALSVVSAALWPGWLGRTAATVVSLVSLLALLHGPEGRRLGQWLARPVRRTNESFRRSDLVAEVLCPLVVVAVVLGLFHQIFLGEVPLGADHPLHLFNGWVMAERLLPTWRLNGWVAARGAGFPAGIEYPQGASLLLAAIRFCLPSSVSWEMVYGIGFVGAMLFCQLAIYLAGRSIGGPWAGLLAALFSSLDQGAYRQGGYAFSVSVGVWPISLSMAFGLLGIVLLHRALDRPGSRMLALVAVLFGAAVLTHPMSVAFLGLAVPVLVLHAALEAERRGPLAVAARGFLAAGLGGAIAAYWLVPFLAFSGYALDQGTGSWSLASQASGVVQLDLFVGMWCLPAGLALVGGIGAWRRRLPAARFLTLLFALIALVTNGDTILALELDRWWDRLANLQPQRYYLYLRPIAFLLAGLGAVLVLERVGEVFSDRVGAVRRWGLRVLACVAFGVFLVPVAEAVFWSEVSPRGRYQGLPTAYRHYQEVCDFIREDARAHAAEHRGYVRSTWPTTCWLEGGGHCYETSPVYTGIGHLHPSWHSAATFKGLFGFRGRGSSMAMYRALGVRYLVTTAARRDLREVFRSGELRVYEVNDVAQGPHKVIGRARVRLESFEDERVRFTVQGAGPGDRMSLSIPYFPNWHATLDGREVPIEVVSVQGINEAMALQLADGALELRYDRGVPEATGAAITCLALLICLLLAVGRWPAPRTWLDRCSVLAGRSGGWLASRRRVLVVAGLVLAALALALVAVRVASRFLADRPRFDTVTDFDRARVWYRAGGERHRCHRTWAEDWRCGPERYKLVGTRYDWTEMGRPRGAIYAHPFKRAELHVDFPDVELGTGLEGGLGISHDGRGRAKVVLQVWAGGRKLGEESYARGNGWRTFRYDTRALAGEVVRLGFVVTAENNHQRMFLFRARTTDDGVLTDEPAAVESEADADEGPPPE